MARPTKEGLDYFSFDVDFFQNIKVRKIKMACGPQSVSILICLLCNIYRNKGYCILWDEDMPFLIADEVGVSEGAVIETLKKAVQVGFFDQKLSEKKVITSVEIQKRYRKIVTSSKRIGCEIPPCHNLLSVDNGVISEFPPEETMLTPEETRFPPEESTQSKVKESKVNNNPPISPQGGSSAEELSSNEPEVEATFEKRKKVAPKKEKPEPPAIEEFVAYGLANITGVTSYRLDLWENALRLKYKAWLEAGWKTGGKNPKDIQVWKTTLLHTIPYLERVVSMQIHSQPQTSKLEHNLSVVSRTWGIN